MKCLVLADHRIFYGMFARSVGSLVEPCYWLEKGERTPYPEMAEVFRGDAGDAATYAGFDPAEDHAAVLYFQGRAEAERAARAIESALPRSTFLFIGLEEQLPAPDRVARGLSRTWEQVISRRLADEVRALVTRTRVEYVRGLFADASKVAILLHDDPDPDALASGLCFRNLIGRNRLGAPLVAFGGIARPENREMARLLDIPVETVTPEQLAAYDRIACVDVQPDVFADKLGGRDVDAVIDHHPEQPGYRARYRDIRATYGATSTILTEYLRGVGVDVNQRQATALLYGIKTDTLFLDREVTEADAEAFLYLYKKANLNLVRRIEKPAIPRDSLERFGEALQRLQVAGGLSFGWLGAVAREDVIPQLAEFLLQVEDAEWSVAAGIHDGRVIASIRNAGYQRAAGDVAKRVFGDIGSAGGHRSMAKAVVPVERFVEAFGGADEVTVHDVFYGPFLAEAMATGEG